MFLKQKMPWYNSYSVRSKEPLIKPFRQDSVIKKALQSIYKNTVPFTFTVALLIY